MSRIALVAAVAVTFALSACGLAEAKVTGSGTSRTEARTTADFTQIEVRGAITLEVTVGGARAVEVTADDNVVPIIRTAVTRGRLVIESTDSYSSKAPVRVRITTPALDALSASGSSRAQVTGVDGESLTLAVSGSGSIEATGEARAATIAISGSGRIRARGLPLEDATVSVSGSGAVELSASRAMTVQVSGSGRVDYWGKPSITKAVSGSGKITGH